MKKEERDYYYYWASEKGACTRVILRYYLGLRGYNNYIQTKKHNDIVYAGEVWDCITVEDGDPIRGVFRIPYDDLGIRREDKKVDDRTEEILEITNYHTDGIIAYESGDMSMKDDRQLKKQEEKLAEKIINLKNIFNTLSNSGNSHEKLLKLGIQLYLRRLENPNHQTSKEWRLFCQKESEIQIKIIKINE